MSYYKDQKGPFGLFVVLSEHNNEQNEPQAVFCSIYSATEYLEASGDPVTTVYHP